MHTSILNSHIQPSHTNHRDMPFSMSTSLSIQHTTIYSVYKPRPKNPQL